MIPIPILVTGRDAASEVLVKNKTFKYVVSIGEKGTIAPNPLYSYPCSKLRLEFDDCEHDLPHPQLGYYGCTREQVHSLVEFYRSLLQDPGPTLIHCAAGISRSSASAAVLLCMLHQNARHVPVWLEDARRYTKKHQFRGIEPFRPNRRVVAMADEVLGYNLLPVIEAFYYKDQKPFELEPEWAQR